MLERGLLPDFSPEAQAEASALTGAARADGPSVRDLRSLLWASIDNDDSRDLDQLTVAEPLAGGAARILVAIADVDATVRAGSAVDDHARTNTTSVYTAAQIFPMLPERLSTDLTSLAENEDRLAVVVEMTVGADGTIPASDLYRAKVRNRAKLAYASVAAWLDGVAPPPARVAAVPGMDAQLRIQDRAAQSLKQRRHAHGALSLETLEARPVFDADALKDVVVESQNRAKAARDSGRFEKEIVPVEVEHEGVKGVFKVDEGIRDSSLEKLSTLVPSFGEDGLHHAGNSSQITDGAAAVLMMSAEKAKELKLRPRARIVAQAVVGSDPHLMLTGPLTATPAVLKKAGLKIEDIDVVEINEAFASVVLSWAQVYGVSDDDLVDKVNVNGGAIALGHPLGCTGAKLTTQLIYEMARRKSKYGMVSMCVGGGMGAATIFENLQ